MGPFPNAKDRVSNITPKAGCQELGELHTTARLEMPKCLCNNIDLHLYEMPVNDDDGVPLATPKMLRVDAQQLICLRGVEPKHRAEYIKAVAKAKELTGLLQLGTFAICREGECDDLKPLGSKFVLRIKYLADSSLDKYKARIVALGHMARAGIDFYSTWSPPRL